MFLIAIDQNGLPTGYPITAQNFRFLFPQISFPGELTENDTLPFGYAPYELAEKPEIGTFEKAVEVAPIKDEFGCWRQVWAVEPMTEQEVAVRTEQEWIAVRGNRNSQLERSDWTQLDDTPLTNTVKQQWASYRQALRDITEQPDPFNIVWPAIPA